jgi:tRNA G10  N-methylase Trm11
MIRNDKPLFDAIVCDPPYGVRARSQAVGVADHKKEKYDERKPKDITIQEMNK